MHFNDGVMRTRRAARTAAAIALTIGTAAGCSGTGGGSRNGRAAASPSSASPSSGQSCAPRITDSGFTNDSGYIWYGLIVQNPCKQASVNNKITVVATDASGQPISTEEENSGANLPVILPGQRLGLAALITVSHDADKVAALSVHLTHRELAPAGAFAAWPKTVKAQDISFTKPDAAGSATMTFSLATEPPHAPLCNPVAQIILRDRAGRIVYGRSKNVNGPFISVDVTLPPSADVSKAEVYVAQGRYQLGTNILTAMACGNGA
jgi:hypothetical protein